MAIRLSYLCGMALLLAIFGGAVRARAPAPAFAPPTVLLSPLIPEAPRATQARGVFYTATTTVNLPSGSMVLEASADGGALCTDDEARLTVLRDDQVALRWSHRFNSPDRREIVCLPPQQLTLPTGPGQYHVQIELADLYPPTYGSQPYYVAAVASVASPGLTATSAPADAHSASPRPSASAPTLSDVPQATGQLPFGAAAERDSPAPLNYENTGVVLGIPILGGIGTLMLAGGALLALAALLLALGRRRARRRSGRADTPAGIVYLYDHETRQARTAMLGRAGVMAIQRRPLELVPQARATNDRSIGQIRLDDAGPYLYDPLAGTPNDQTQMRPDITYALSGGAVTVRYRAPTRVWPLERRTEEARS